MGGKGPYSTEKREKERGGGARRKNEEIRDDYNRLKAKRGRRRLEGG
jgi:hypothetical protein